MDAANWTLYEIRLIATLYVSLFFLGWSCTCGGIAVTYVDGLQHCFEVIGGGQSWVNSDLMCAGIGGHLAHIDTAAKENLVIDYIKQVREDIFVNHSILI